MLLASDLDVPLMHGATFFSSRFSKSGWDTKRTPEEIASDIQQLREIKEQGFQMASPFVSIWGQPSATAMFEWADTNEFPLVLMIQGCDNVSPKGLWNLDRYADDPSIPQVVKLGEKWARTIAGHPQVRGVILGNEVRPRVGTPETDPRFWALIRNELAVQYDDDLEVLNRNWGTRYGSFAEIGLPPAGSGGYHDLRHIARRHFMAYFDTLIRDGFKPILGDSVFYCSKHSRPDPFAWRASKEISCANWDDVTATFPLWAIKASADTTSLPLFNSELHLYHDKYQYMGSAELSRYRYFTSALLGEYWTCSFGLSGWKKKADVLANHEQTPNVLRDLEKTQQYFRALAKAYQQADLNVLLTEENWFFDAARHTEGNHDPSLLRNAFVGNFGENPFAEVYARMSMLGKPWRYYLENDLSQLKKGTLVVWSPLLKLETAQALAELPGEVRLIFADALPTKNPYHLPLPQDVTEKLAARSEVVKLAALEKAFDPASIMHPAYQKYALVRYFAWSRIQGGLVSYGVPYARLEVRSAETPEGHLVAILNNDRETVLAPLPWTNGNYRATDLLTGETLSSEDARKEREFAPYAVMLFRLEPAS